MSFMFELVSPESVLFSEKISQVVLPASEGEVTVLGGHAPFMSPLRAGIVSVDDKHRFFVYSGFVDVSNDSVTLLAEKAESVDMMSIDHVRTQIEKLETDAAAIKEKMAQDALQDQITALRLLLSSLQH